MENTWSAVNKNIPVRFAQIKLIVNDRVIQTKAEPFIYNGSVYAPVATVANALGIDQAWDNKTPAVRFSTSNTESGFKAKNIEAAFKDTPPLAWLDDSTYVGKTNTPLTVTHYDPKGAPYNEASDYVLVDLSDLNEIKKVPVLSHMEWVPRGKVEILTPQFVSITGTSKKEFMIYELTSSIVQGKYRGDIKVFQYESGVVKTVNNPNLFDGSPYEARVSYSPSTKEVTAQFVDADGKIVRTETRKPEPGYSEGYYTIAPIVFNGKNVSPN